MRIIVNTKAFLSTPANEPKSFIDACFERLAAQYPHHDFIFITDKQLSTELASLKNITPLVIDTELKTILKSRLWYNYKLSSLIRKHKADVLINTNGICSLRTKTPQLVIVQNLLFLDYPQFVLKKMLQFYKKFTLPSLNKAKTIITTSQSVKTDIIENYKTDENKVDVVYTAVNELFKPIEWKEKESIKEKYTQGKEFFLFTSSLDAVNNLITLLKAFSFFKKRQKSNMQLVIAITSATENESFTQSLKTYKYRNEIILLPDLSEAERAKITAAAYAFVYPSYLENDGSLLLQPMQCAVPVIAPETIFYHEICADAALYVTQNQHEDISDKMMLVFKDEKKRDELIEKGKQRLQQYSWDKATKLLWHSIEKTVQP